VPLFCAADARRRRAGDVRRSSQKQPHRGSNPPLRNHLRQLRSHACERLDQDEVELVSVEHASGRKQASFVTESGLFSLILGSRAMAGSNRTAHAPEIHAVRRGSISGAGSVTSDLAGGGDGLRWRRTLSRRAPWALKARGAFGVLSPEFCVRPTGIEPARSEEHPVGNGACLPIPATGAPMAGILVGSLDEIVRG
jgi:hypothetical protein